jgi:pilus assembly protein FimV
MATQVMHVKRPAPSASDVDLDLDFSLGDDEPATALAPMPAAAVAAPVRAAAPVAPEPMPALDMNFDVPSPAPAPAIRPVTSVPTRLDAPALVVSENDLDFNAASATPAARAAAPVTTPAAPAVGPDSGMIEFDMGSLSLDLPSASAPAHSSAVASPASRDSGTAPLIDLEGGSTGGFEMESASDDPLATKLALAQEFNAIGDPDGARSLAEEVLAEASGELKTRAQRFLAEIN